MIFEGMTATVLYDDSDEAGPSLRERFAAAATDFEAWSIEPMLDVEPQDAHDD